MLTAILLSQVNAAGVAIGSPLGIAVVFEGGFRAIGGWNFNRGSFYMSIDRDFYLNSTTLHPMDAYMGFGGYVAGIKVSPPGEPDKLDLFFGVRVPLGLEYDFSDIPVAVGIEAVPVLGIYPSTDIFMFADIYLLFRFK